MRTICDVLFPTVLRDKGGIAGVRRFRHSVLGLVVLIVLTTGSRAMGGSIIPPSIPIVQQATLADICPYGQDTYSFSHNNKTGPLAYDFAKANDPSLTTAQYQFSGSVNGTPVFAQWSPAANATGGFVPFLGNNQNGNPLGSSTKVKPTTVAYITDAFGNQYGYVQAQYNTASSRNNTTFTVVNTSRSTIDATLSGEQIGASVSEQFIGTAPTVTTPPNNAISYTSAQDQAGGGFTVSNILVPETGAGAPVNLTLTAKQQFTATTSPAPDSLTMASGAVTIYDVNGTAPGAGGSGSILGTATITSGSSTIQTLSLSAIKFSGGGGTTTHFSSETAEGGLTGLTIGGTYTLTVNWNIQFTPSDKYASISADPGIVFNFSDPSVTSVPVPPTLVLAVIGAVCLIGFRLAARRARAIGSLAS